MISNTEKTRLAHKKILHFIGKQWNGDDDIAEEQAIQYLAALSIMGKSPNEIRGVIQDFNSLNESANNFGFIHTLGNVQNHVKDDLKSFFLDNKGDISEKYKARLKDTYREMELLLKEKHTGRMAYDFIKKFSADSNSGGDRIEDATRYIASVALCGRPVSEILDNKEMLTVFNKHAHEMGITSESGIPSKETRTNIMRYFDSNPGLLQKRRPDGAPIIDVFNATKLMLSIDQKTPQR